MDTVKLNKYWNNKEFPIGKIDEIKLNTYWENKNPKKQPIIIAKPEPKPEPKLTPQEMYDNYIQQNLLKMKGEPSNSKLAKECRRYAWRKHNKKDILKSVNIVVFWNSKTKREVRKFLKLGNTIKQLKKRTYNRPSKSFVKPQAKNYLSRHKLNPQDYFFKLNDKKSNEYLKWLDEQIIKCELHSL